MTFFSEFIETHRERFTMEGNNTFAMSFSQVSRYYEFIKIILARWEEASQLLATNTKGLQASFLPGGQPLTNDQMALHEDGSRLNIRVHLEIESFYLFAKILLDRVAHSLECYFGLGRKASLASHDKLVKNFVSYAQRKGLTVSTEFMVAARGLQGSISDYRDKEIAHEKDPRRMSGTLLDADGRAQIAGITLYPNKTDRQIDSKALHVLLAEVETYLREVITLITSNQEKTQLQRE
jgi:hypothetical protein